MPTRWCGAPSCCRTGSAEASASSSSPRTEKQKEAEAAGADTVGGEDRREDPGRLDGFRRGRRDPGHDARGRQAGPKCSALGALMPNPEDRHGDRRCGEGRRRDQGRARSSIASTRPASCTRRSARRRFRAENLVENASGLGVERRQGEAGRGEGKYVKSIAVSSTMGPGVRVDDSAEESDQGRRSRLRAGRAGGRDDWHGHGRTNGGRSGAGSRFAAAESASAVPRASSCRLQGTRRAAGDRAASAGSGGGRRRTAS